MRRSFIPVLSAALANAGLATAAIHTETIEYRQGDTVLEGFLAWDDSVSGRRPGIVVVHQWKGLTDYERKRAEMLAELGYVAFAADIYGKGVRAKDVQEAAQLAGKYKSNPDLLRARVNAAVDRIKADERVDPEKVAAIGYCFGGTAVLELARSGANVEGVVSFHGGLATPKPAGPGDIKCKVLACHGADDPFESPREVAEFQDEMRKAGVDWQMIIYSGAVHSFTDWNAGSDNSSGAAYNEKADKRSWQAMQQFFAELFGSK